MTNLCVYSCSFAVSFGGIGCLFFGGSLVSLIEIFYFLAVKLIQFVSCRRKWRCSFKLCSRNKWKTPVQDITFTETIDTTLYQTAKFVTVPR